MKLFNKKPKKWQDIPIKEIMDKTFWNKDVFNEQLLLFYGTELIYRHIEEFKDAINKIK